MTFRSTPVRSIGYPDVNGVYATLGAPFSADAGGNGGDLPSVTTAAQPGEIVSAWDPVNGFAEFIFLSVAEGAAITPGLLYSWQAASGNGPAFQAELMPTAVSAQGVSGWPVAVAVNAVVANANNIQYTWFQITGYTTVLKAGTIKFPTAGAIFLSGVTQGRIRSTASAFRTIIGMRLASITTIATTTSTVPVFLNRPNMGPGI